MPSSPLLKRSHLTFLFAAMSACGDGSGPDGGTATSIQKQTATDNQTAAVGTTVSSPPSVVVRDADGDPVRGVTVTFAITAGGGSITGATQTTNAAGIATVGSWTLGNTPGENRLEATVSGLTAVSFLATAVDPCEALVDLAFGSSANGTLTSSDCLAQDNQGSVYYTDLYATPVSPAGAVRFSMTSTAVDAYIELYTLGGEFVAVNDDAGSGTNASIKALLGSGSYVLAASTSFSRQSGAYGVSVQSTASSIEQCEDVWATKGITTAQTLTATDCLDDSGQYYSDQIFIALQAGQRVVITMSSTAVDAYLTLYDSDNLEVASDDDSAGGTDARIDFTATSDDLYLLDASAFDEADTGAYTLSIQ